MIPKRLKLENFLSFADAEIVFTDDEPLWVVGGPNGTGKSAIFDAMTFCLFGAHRGGARGYDRLTRHGANSFSVVLEFEFNGVMYRIAKNRMGARATQSVEYRIDGGDWERVPNVNNANEVKTWTESTLGLGFEAFKASVLLRQGESDAIITATGAERLKILKSIIGVERYEVLSERVHDQTRLKKTELGRLKQQREHISEVTPEHLSSAALHESNVRQHREGAEQRVCECDQRVSHAKQWANLDPKQRELTQHIHDADARAADAEQIRTDHARYLELLRVLPILRQWLPLRQSVVDRESNVIELAKLREQAEHNCTEISEQLERSKVDVKKHLETAELHERKAKQLRNEITQQERFLKSADEFAVLQSEWESYPATLDSDHESAVREHTEAKQSLDLARQELIRVEVLLADAEKNGKRFENLKIGIECSACGQEVTAEHAEKERRNALEKVTERKQEHVQVSQSFKDAMAIATNAENRQSLLGNDVSKRNQLSQRLNDKRNDLESHGGTVDASQLREQIERSRSEVERNSADAGNSRELYRQADSNEKELTGCLRKAIADATTAKKNHETVEKKWNDEVAKCGALRDQLALEWHTTTLLELNTFEEAQKGYLESRIVNRFQELQSDERMRAEWERQLDDVNVQIESIPMADHVSVVVAEQQHRVAKSDFQQAEVDLRTAEVATTELKKRAEEFTTLVQTITTVERDWSLHERLDELLGKKGLQRELVRDAEQQIVGFAQETVRQLSDGELSIELDRTESSDDQAFLLNVRRGDGSTAIPVEYLSGSQKFRVAVAIALAIGRFAAGQARPLECVIIDEGFGSLDRDGLRATAEELNRLRGKLRRIILVSHQEEFTEHFPVVIQLSKGENGTCVEMRRR